MGVGRKLYIDDGGLDSYVGSVYGRCTDSEEFPDYISCKDKVMNQLKLASRLPKIQSISVLSNGFIRFRTNDLFITTSDTGRVRKFFVGKWVIEIDYWADLYFKSQNKAELGFTSSVWSGQLATVHPHISRKK